MKSNEDFAKQALSLIDLTSLNDSDTAESIVALCNKAVTAFGNVAAVCVYPKFVGIAKQHLRSIGANDIKVATVTNFPHGRSELSSVIDETKQAIADGADEIDVVIDYQSFNNGNTINSHSIVSESHSLCEEHGVLLKVIIETGELQNLDVVKAASQMAIEAGADFIKTSTGKVTVNSTLEFSEAMLKSIVASDKAIGFKAAGGIRSFEDAKRYIIQAERILNISPISAERFRFGASGLLDSLIAELTGDKTGDGNQASTY